MQTSDSSQTVVVHHAGVQTMPEHFLQETRTESVDTQPVIITGIYRSNLHYRVIPITSELEKLAETVKLAQTTRGAGIVYAATAKAVEAVHHALSAAGESVTSCHGQLPAELRNANRDAYMKGAIRIMVATGAFSSGIDKQDIRFVIHFQIPASPAIYCQDSSLAGRDGKDAECTLLYYQRDKQVQQFLLARRYPGADEVGTVYASLQAHAAGNVGVSLARLQETHGAISDGKLHVALTLLMEAGLVEQDEHYAYRLRQLRAKQKELAAVVDSYHEQSARDHAALERMVQYAQTGLCRWKTLLQFVGEQVEWSRCGVCDNCLQPPEQALSPEHVRQSAPLKKQERKPPLPHIGSTVRVARFGEGRVVACAGDKITISFPDKRTRTFLRDYVEST